jgi:uncharacterized membrane protein YhaH (DUF805 family)
MEWMILPFKRYADFQGRSRRKEYWMFMLLNIGILVILLLPAFVFAPGTSSSEFASDANSFSGASQFESNIFENPVSLIFFGLYGIYALAALIPSIAVTVRRLHDRDMSGWWYLGLTVAGVIPLIGILASIALLVLMVLPGTPGSNRFGADPKDPYAEDVFA